MIRPTARYFAAAAVLAAGGVAGYLVERRLLSWLLGADLPEPPPVTSRPVELCTVRTSDGIDLHVEVHEPQDPSPDDLTIVFSHGFAMSTESWAQVRERLPSDVRLVSYDHRSHGRSGRGGRSTHNIDQLGEDLERVLDQVVPEGPVVLAGHSMGGMTILALADQRPELFGERIRAVGLISTSAGGIPEVTLGLNPRAARFLHGSTKGLPQIATIAPAVVDRWRRTHTDLELLMIRLYAFGDKVPIRESEFVATMIGETSIKVVAEFLPALEEHDKRDALPALSEVPTLVVVGDSDLLTPVSHSESMAEAVPGARLVVLPRTGHMTLTERSVEVTRGITLLVEHARDGAAERGPAD